MSNEGPWKSEVLGGGFILWTGGKIISASDSPDKVPASSLFPVAGGGFCRCCWLGLATVAVACDVDLVCGSERALLRRPLPRALAGERNSCS